VICRGSLGRVEDDALGVDWVDIDWTHTLRRAMRLVSRAGRRVDVLLPPGGRLAHGDLLVVGETPVAVWLAEIDLLKIVCPDPVVRARVAFDLGNLHLPAQMTPVSILTPDDGPARQIAHARHAEIEPVRQRFYPEPVVLEPNRLRPV
jgi:urease accessory protein